MTDDFIKKLMVSKQIMDRHNDIPRGNAQGGITESITSPSQIDVYEPKPVATNYNIPQEYLDQAFEQLTRTLKNNSTVHQGIYKGNKAGLSIFTAIGGLGNPTAKLEELKKLST